MNDPLTSHHHMSNPDHRLCIMCLSLYHLPKDHSAAILGSLVPDDGCFSGLDLGLG